jgi:hypothetical protein
MQQKSGLRVLTIQAGRLFFSLNEDIIRMAQEAGLAVSDVAPEIGFIWCSEEYPIDEEIYRFAELVAAAEREACAKRLDAVGCDHCAENIRLRGKE